MQSSLITISYSLFRKALLTWSLFQTPHFSCNSCVCQHDFLSADTAYMWRKWC